MLDRAVPRLTALLVCAPLLALGCDKDKPSDAEATAQSPTLPSSSGSSGRSGARLPAIELPLMVPASAAGLVVIRTPESLFATIAGFDMLGEPDAADTKALREELDEFLERRVGITLTDVDHATIFFVPKKGVAAVIEGTKGEPKGKAVGEHEGTPLFALGEREQAVMAQHNKDLIVGEPDAVRLALQAAAGKEPSLSKEGGPLADLLTEGSKGVTFAAAVEVSALPRSIREDIDDFGVERALLQYGGEGIRVVANGEESAMKTLLSRIEGGMTMLVSMTEGEKRRLVEGDDTFEGVGGIYAHHTAMRLRKLVQPKLDGRELSMEIPVRLQDPTLLTAMAGIGAAIAIPAMTKYMRRSKTSEARVQIAKMFDAASAYFNEEHVSRGAVAILGGGAVTGTAPHQCPNDGRLKGESGITPPLSVNCNEGPGGRCVPVAGTPRGPGEYSMSQWTDSPVWNGLNFQQEQGHAFHYNFVWENTDHGFGTCQFTAQAFADLDDDGVFSTFERAGAADEHGVNAAAGLYIDREVE